MLQDFKVTVAVVDDVVHMEGEHISMEDLVYLAWYLQMFVGTEGLKLGLDMDDVRNNMYDVYSAAMETIEENLRAGRIDPGGVPGGEVMQDGKEETAD